MLGDANRGWHEALTSRNSLGRKVGAVLMQGQADAATAGIGLKRNLGVDNFVEKFPRAFRKNLDFGLAGGLGEELSALARNRQDEGWRQLILARVSVAEFRINGNLFVLRRRGGRGLSLNPLGWHIGAVLVQRQAGGTAVRVGLKGDLRIDDL